MSHSHSPSRRRSLYLLAAAAAAPLAITSRSYAQSDPASYPNRVVRLINPWNPGGPADIIAQPIVQGLAAAWKQPVIMEHKTGANGVIGTQFVVKAPPDGYTLLLSQLGPNVIAPSLGKGTPYDPITDFAPITQIESNPLVLVVRPELKINTVAELIAYGKANPTALSYASGGSGSNIHLAGEMLKQLAGINMIHVPYKGAAPIIADMFGGSISASFLNPSVVAQHVASGKLKAIGVTTAKRSPSQPSIPAISETLPGFDVTSWYGLMAPAGTPAPIIDKIYRQVSAIVRTPEVTGIYRAGFLDVDLTTPDEYARSLKIEVARYAKLIKDFKITGAE